jgi:hypothetical protein
MLYKYVGTSGIGRILTEKPTVRFTPPVDLNDPFEFFPIATPLLSVMEAEQQEKYFEMRGVKNVGLAEEIPWIGTYNAITSWKASLGSPSRRIGILSLSSDPCSNLLWAHYASNFKGIAVGFNSDARLFSESVVDEYAGPAAVCYRELRIPDAIVKGFDAGDADRPAHYLTKGKEWRYEREYRCFRYLSDTETIGGKVGVVHFERREIKEVIFGMGLLTGDGAFERIAQLSKWTALEPTVALKVASPHPERFEVTISQSPPIGYLEDIAAI